MLKNTTYALVKFSGANKALDRWLQHRQLLVSGFQHLIENTRKREDLPDIQATQYWCQELVDYLTTGHFQIFSESKNMDQAHQLDNDYHNIADTTPILISLQHQLCELTADQNSRFDHLLSALGEILSYRIELESTWIASSLQHSQQEVTDDTSIN